MGLAETDRVRTGYKTEVVINFDDKVTVVVEEVSEFKMGLFRLGDVAQMELWLKMGGVTAQVQKNNSVPPRLPSRHPPSRQACAGRFSASAMMR
jgi:hypothetical protein